MEIEILKSPAHQNRQGYIIKADRRQVDFLPFNHVASLTQSDISLAYVKATKNEGADLATILKQARMEIESKKSQRKPKEAKEKNSPLNFQPALV
ncbi:MAG: hypothetical protein KTR28_06355 [Micavibrio sp.]|nr:hypothetical protein [Micavibrio sp.]